MKWLRDAVGYDIKLAPFVSTEWRQSARGMPCTLQTLHCNGDRETTVLCHIRRHGMAGVGQKPHDFNALFACAACHQAMDTGQVDGDNILRALMQTLTIHYAQGRI